MKKLSYMFCFCFLMFGGVFTYAQSGRGTTNSTTKQNARPTEPSPSPSPPLIENVTAQAEPDALDDAEIINVDTQVVSVPVRVLDKKNRFFGGLTKENFKVFENGVEQEIALFSNENQPFTVALVLDMSYSTKFKISEIQSAAIAFIDQLRPQDKVMVVSFDDDVHMLCEATNDRKIIYRAIRSTKIDTGTSLYEAIEMVMNDRLRRIGGRKALILFSDGVDTTSRRFNDLDNLNDAMELDALIYPIRYDTFADVQAMKNKSITLPPPITAPTPKQEGNPFPFPIPTIGTPGGAGTTEQEYKRGEEYLEQLANRTGGRTYLASSLGNLASAFTKIASELREFYSLAYYPKEIRTAETRTNIKVRVDQPGLIVRARETYLNRRKKK